MTRPRPDDPLRTRREVIDHTMRTGIAVVVVIGVSMLLTRTGWFMFSVIPAALLVLVLLVGSTFSPREALSGPAALRGALLGVVILGAIAFVTATAALLMLALIWLAAVLAVTIARTLWPGRD